MSFKGNRSYLLDTRTSPFAHLQPVCMQAVRLNAGFWSRWLGVNRARTLPFQHQYLESTGRLDNIRRAARQLAQPFRGTFYDESDVYKWVEAAYWALGKGDDPGLLKRVDAIVRDLQSAQGADGYLNTYFVQDLVGDRWSDLQDMHELYCAGHLIQAGIAGSRSVGDDRLLQVAIRYADHICEVFGPETGRQQGAGGHPGIEMALVELYRTTGTSRYLRQAGFFLDQRGHGLIGGQVYHQDHLPFRALERLAGHAVRALYLNAGAADLYLETGDRTLLDTLERLWEKMTTRQLYLTGGVGARAEGEAFGEDYELPNLVAYAESCAAIANLMWNWRMFQMEGQARFMDLVEKILYNGMLVGMASDGCEYFYRNPLASTGDFGRAPWYSCACCPPNLARSLETVPGMIFSQSEDAIWVNLYIDCYVEVQEGKNRGVALDLSTRYPWEDEIQIVLKSAGDFSVHLRIPEWVAGPATVVVNGDVTDRIPSPGKYFKIHRRWDIGDRVQLFLPMAPRRVVSHPAVQANQGRVALMRGPLVYCLEGVDNPAIDPNRLVIPDKTDFLARFDPDILDGVIVLEGEGILEHTGEGWNDRLYVEVKRDHAGRSRRSVSWKAVPYYAWANRGRDWMQVWIRCFAA